MTKYEWETELKRNIHRLPDDEIKRVMEYYGELFEDKAERGKTEREIINGFGNPVDVADKILSEYDGELKEENASVVAPTSGAVGDNASPSDTTRERADEVVDGNERADKKHRSIQVINEHGKVRSNARSKSIGTSMARLLLFFLLNAITGFVFFIVMGSIWIVLCAVTVASGAIGIGGAAAAVVSLGPLFVGHVGAGLAQLGMSLALIGAGALLTIVCIKVIKLCAKLTVKFFRALKNWISAKECENA